jgi:N utilization substance protein A
MNEIGDQEKIDIITFSDDIETYIKNALSPTEVIRVELNKNVKHAKVIVDQSQLSIAIGKGGQNVRLASKLSGYELDIESGTPTPVVEAKPEVIEPVTEEAPVVENSPAKKPVKPKRRDDIEAGLLGAIEEHGE